MKDNRANAELDRAVGVTVMGCRVIRRRRHGTFDLLVPGGINSIDWVQEEGAWRSMPPYSSDMNAAWTVVQKVLKEHCEFFLEFLGTDQWRASFPTGSGSGKTAPEAICRAALVGKKEAT